MIVFSFMYQPNLPAVYSELKIRTYSTMWFVIFFATSIACICYGFAGYFGFATFACDSNVKEIMEMENIFEAPYQGNKFILVGKLVLLAGVILASPMCLMPAKDTIEELFLGQER